MNSKTTAIVCGAILVIALGALWFQFKPVTVKIDRTPIVGAATGVGLVLAEQTVQAIQNHGRIVLVIDYTPGQRQGPADARWDAFHQELKNHPAITIAATEVVQPEPEMGMPGCPRSALSRILNQHADAAAVVFFTELPEWNAAGDVVPQLLVPKLIAVDTMGNLTRNHYAGYFSSGALQSLIGTRQDSSAASASQPTTPREWFDKYHQIYNQQNYETLPE